MFLLRKQSDYRTQLCIQESSDAGRVSSTWVETEMRWCNKIIYTQVPKSYDQSQSEEIPTVTEVTGSGWEPCRGNGPQQTSSLERFVKEAEALSEALNISMTQRGSEVIDQYSSV